MVTSLLKVPLTFINLKEKGLGRGRTLSTPSDALEAHSAKSKMEVHVNRFQLSPAARLLVSFALVIGILVAGQTHPYSSVVGRAQTESGEAVVTRSIGIGTTLPISRGEVVASLIEVRGVWLNGEPVDAVVADRLDVLDSLLISDSFMTINGVVVGGTVNDTPKDGVVVGGTINDETPEGEAPVTIATEVDTQEVVISAGEGGVQLLGGELRGDNISVVDGVVRGENLRVVGATVSGGALSVAGVLATAPGY